MQSQPYGRAFQSRNPFTNKVTAEFSFLSNEELNTQIQRSWNAFRSYRQTDLATRREKLLKLASLIDENPEKYAQIVTEEMGKPFTAAIAEVKKAAVHCRYYAENAEAFMKPKLVETEHKRSQVEYHPLGPIFHICPFNFPFFLVFKGGIPALLMGNTLLHRPADSTPRCGRAVEELMIQAGFDNGEFITVYSSQEQTETVLAHKNIRGVSFTGSTRAGRIIASIAGKYAKKAVMELGGSDPFIVLDDADLGKAVDLAMTSRLGNGGQVCFSGKRFLVDDKIYEQFKEKLLEKLPEYKIGDPMDKETLLGPLARPDLLENIDRQVKEGVSQGAKVLFGGKKPEEGELKEGNFYMPTLCEVDRENILMKEETFGPVFALTKVNGENDAIEVANDTEYGLGCVIVSENIERAEKVGQNIDSGFVFVNTVVRSDSRLPSGGVKGSGFGRECAEFGVYEFANIKTIVIN